MWGNTTGWIIAAVIGAGMGLLLWMVAVPPSPTPPTNLKTFDVAYKTISLPVPADTVVTSGVGECDAGDLYQKAIDAYLKKSAPYEKFLHGGAGTIKASQLPAVDFILKARDCKHCNLFSKNPARIINYDNTEPPLEALEQLGQVCTNLGLIENTKKSPQAVKYWEAAFELGRHLYEERITFAELQRGLGMMQAAAINLQRYYAEKHDDARAATLRNFIDEERTHQDKLIEAWKIIGSVAENYAGPYAGDIFKIAQTPTAEPMFRVEALKHIGHYRYNVMSDKKGDQLMVRKVLGKMAKEPNLPPTVKEAVKAAQDLTIEQHNMVGGSA